MELQTYDKLKRTVSQVLARTTETVLPSSVVLRLRAAREWKRWVDSLTPEVLDDLTNAPLDAKRRVFKKYVRLVEIETHAKCNRICSFCPNVVVDRRRNKTLADTEVLDRVFEELGSIDYAGQVKVARYSEPLTNREYLYERIESARRLVPHAQLAIVTNTDYLTAAVLARLREAGLDVVYMSIYLRPKERWTPDLARAYSERLAEKLGVRLTEKLETPNSLRCMYEYEGLRLSSSCHNWDEYGTDRGGSVAQYSDARRIGSCREPFETFVIDYDGSVMPCCALRSDLPQHRKLVVSNLSVPGTSIFDVYAGRLSTWRRSMVGFGVKTSPCTTCLHRDIPEALVTPVAARLKQRLHRVGRDKLYKPPVSIRPAGTLR